MAGVVAFHLGHLQGGFLGVDLFFTLSGYLITRLLLLEHQGTGRISLRAFWTRRAWRLLPALFLVLGAVALYAAIAARPDEYSGIRDSGIASLLYAANWYFISTGDSYWNLFTAPTPFDHLWSLAIEEQFYVVWPMLVAPLIGRQGRSARLLGTTAALLVLTSLALALDEPGRAYLSTVSRSSSILLGALLGTLIHRRDRLVEVATRDRTGDVIGTVAVAYLLWSWISVDGAADAAFYKGGFLAHALAVTVIIAIVTQRSTGLVARVLSFAPFRLLGVVSYGFYLWHWPVILIFNLERVGYGGFPLVVTRLVITLAVTVASYWAIERPARRSWSRRAGALVGLPIAALVIAVALVAATVAPTQTAVLGETPSFSFVPATTVAPVAPVDPVQKTIPSPPDDQPDRSDASPVDETTATGAADRTAPNRSYEFGIVRTTPRPPTLRTPTAAEPLRVLLLGDSYLFDAQPGIEAALEATGIIDASSVGIFGFALTWEHAFQTLSEQVSEHDPDLVITMWARFDDAWLADADYDPESLAAYSDLLDTALAELGSSGAAIAVVGLAPSLTPGIDRVPVDLTINELFLDAAVRFERAFFVDPDPIVAPDGEPVRWIEAETPLLVRKPDVSHFCPDGAARFGLAFGQLVAYATETAPAAPVDWWAGDWRSDPRYDDPPNGCVG